MIVVCLNASSRLQRKYLHGSLLPLGHHPVNWEHFRKEGLRCDILFVRPRYGTKQDSNTIEVVYVFQFAKNVSIKIWFEIKYTFAAIFNLNVDTIVGHWFNSFYVPVHSNLLCISQRYSVQI